MADLTDVEVARAVRKSVRTVQRWCLDEKLPGVYQAGRSWRIPRRALREAGLGAALQADDAARELQVTTALCHELLAEVNAAGEGGSISASSAERDWRAIASELRPLRSVLAHLPNKPTELPEALYFASGRKARKH